MDNDQGFGSFDNDNDFTSKTTVNTQSLFASLMLDDEQIDPFADSSPWGDDTKVQGLDEDKKIEESPFSDDSQTIGASFSQKDKDNDEETDINKFKLWDDDNAPKPSAQADSLDQSQGQQTKGQEVNDDNVSTLTNVHKIDDADVIPTDQDRKTQAKTPTSSRRRQPPRKQTAVSRRTKAALEATARKSGTTFIDPLTSAAKEAEEIDTSLPTTIPSKYPLSEEEEDNEKSKVRPRPKITSTPVKKAVHKQPNISSSPSSPTKSNGTGYRSLSPISRAPNTNTGATQTRTARTSIEPESKETKLPKFDIVVQDPLKVGDTLKSHIIYKVFTTTRSGILDDEETTVRRRYKDFEWLYNNLTFNHPGAIVPPIPEKQSLGRFDEHFIEQRRIGLQSCLRRMVAHPLLYKDPDLVIFLQSQSFGTDSRRSSELKREKYGGLYINHNPHSASLGSSSSGSGATLRAATGSVGMGLASLFGDAFSKQPKAKDAWFQNKMTEITDFETQLRQLLKALEAMTKQRRDLAIGHSELGQSLLRVAENEVNQDLSKSLTNMGSVQQRLKVLQDKQCDKDIATFLAMIEEYIRLCQSVKAAFKSRNRSYAKWQTNLSDLTRKRNQMEYWTAKPAQTTPEQLSELRADIVRIEAQTERSRNQFDDITRLLHKELNRFDRTRIQDIKSTIETFLEGMIETQEEIVMIWDNYLNGISQQETPYGQFNSNSRTEILVNASSLMASPSLGYSGIRIQPPTPTANAVPSSSDITHPPTGDIHGKTKAPVSPGDSNPWN